jgi:RNase P subunit RPR2
MTLCKRHVWRTRSSNPRYVVVACTVCGEVRGAMARYLSAEIASALEPSHEVDPRRHVAFP